MILGVLGTESRSAMYKKSTLPAVLLPWPQGAENLGPAEVTQAKVVFISFHHFSKFVLKGFSANVSLQLSPF